MELPGGRAYEALNILDRAHEQARSTVTSVEHFRGTDSIEPALTALDAQHGALRASLLAALGVTDSAAAAASMPEALIDDRIPQRSSRGPIDSNYLRENLGEADLEWYGSDANPLQGDLQFELHNLLDGKTTLSEVRDILSAEFTPLETAAVARYVAALERIGLVTGKE